MTQLKILAISAAVGLASASCGEVARTGRSPMIMVVDSIVAASGAKPGELGTTLLSDVVTKNSINDDQGEVTLHIILKDQGAPGVTATPTILNAITVNRYRVEYIRADGRNVEGLDVPYAFDGAATATVTASPTKFGFEIVRHNAKVEPPLSALAIAPDVNSPGGRLIISTIAKVTFYGQDLGGNDVQVSANISVNFADFADPQ